MGLFLVGCGRANSLSHLPVSGTVSVSSGEKLNGSITYIPVEGRSGPAATTAVVDGKYRFDETNGPTPGEHRVIVKRIVSKRTTLESRGTPKTDSNSTSAVKNEWSFNCDLETRGSSQRDFNLDAE